MKNLFVILITILCVSCSSEIEIEKIDISYFGKYTVLIDKLGETENYILNNYQISIWAAHTEYLTGIVPKGNDTVI